MNQASRAVAKASGLIVLSSCCFGSLTTLIVLIMQAGLPLVAAMFWRYLLAAGFLFIAIRSPSRLNIGRKRAIQLMLTGGIAQALITYLSLRALEYVPVGPLAFLFYTYPAWVALIAATLGREEMSFAKLTALAIAMSGVVVMVGPGGTTSLSTFGVFFALGIAFLYALYLPVLHRVQSGIPATVSSFYLISGVFIAFMTGGILSGQLQIPTTTVLWGYVILIALFATVIAFSSLVAGLRVLGPVRTSIIAAIEPFFTTLLAAIFLGQAFTRSTVVGGVLIAAAVILLQVTAQQKNAIAA